MSRCLSWGASELKFCTSHAGNMYSRDANLRITIIFFFFILFPLCYYAIGFWKGINNLTFTGLLHIDENGCKCLDVTSILAFMAKAGVEGCEGLWVWVHLLPSFPEDFWLMPGPISVPRLHRGVCPTVGREFSPCLLKKGEDFMALPFFLIFFSGQVETRHIKLVQFLI